MATKIDLRDDIRAICSTSPNGLSDIFIRSNGQDVVIEFNDIDTLKTLVSYLNDMIINLEKKEKNND